MRPGNTIQGMVRRGGATVRARQHLCGDMTFRAVVRLIEPEFCGEEVHALLLNGKHPPLVLAVRPRLLVLGVLGLLGFPPRRRQRGPPSRISSEFYCLLWRIRYICISFALIFLPLRTTFRIYLQYIHIRPRVIRINCLNM